MFSHRREMFIAGVVASAIISGLSSQALSFLSRILRYSERMSSSVLVRAKGSDLKACHCTDSAIHTNRKSLICSLSCWARYRASTSATVECDGRLGLRAIADAQHARAPSPGLHVGVTCGGTPARLDHSGTQHCLA